MSCKTLQLNKCEIKGSTFSGRKFTFQNRDIFNDKFKVVGYNKFKSTAIFTIEGSIRDNSVYFSYSDLEELQSGAYILKFWAEFKDLATELIAVENFKISTIPCCDSSSSGSTEYTLNFGDEIVDYELEITGSKGAPFIYDDFTLQQINDLKQPAIDASVVALGAAENANNAADLANEQAVLANQSATNANQAADLANNATAQAIEATENTNLAINGAVEATENANVATENTINAISGANEATQNTVNAIIEANTATQNAKIAAQVANNAKGWTPLFQFENDGDTRQVNKLVGYVGGTGIAPTDNVGSYVKENGYTLIKSEASNFKGSAGNLNTASDINLSGAISKLSNGMRVFNKVFQSYSAGAQTGIMSIKFPAPTTAITMFDVTLKIYGYGLNFSGEIRVTFFKYNVPNNNIHNVGLTAIINATDNFPTSVIKVGIDNNDLISINLGEPTTAWNIRTAVEVERVSTSFDGFGADWSKGWSRNLETVVAEVPNNYKSLQNIIPTVLSSKKYVVDNFTTIENVGGTPKRTLTFQTPSYNTTGILRLNLGINSYAGYLKIKLTGNFGNANVGGYIEVSGGFGSIPTAIWGNNLKCITSIGPARGAYYIDPIIKRDASDGQCYIEIHKKSVPGNTFYLEIESRSVATINPIVLTSSFDASSTVASLTNEVIIEGSVTAQSFIKAGGLPTQFFKADGSIDINSYLTQAILNAQLANYATLSAVQTFAKTITFLESPVVPNGTLPTHAVNVSQLTAIMVEYANVTTAAIYEVGTKINLDVLINFNTATVNFPTPTIALKGNSVRIRNISPSNSTAITLNSVAKVTMASNVTWEFLCTGTSWVYRKENNLNFTL